jgi:hypothetical protein
MPEKVLPGKLADIEKHIGAHIAFDLPPTTPQTVCVWSSTAAGMRADLGLAQR